MNKPFFLSAVFCAVSFILLCGRSFAQETPAVSETPCIRGEKVQTQGENPAADNPENPFEITADSFEYEVETGAFKAEGCVTAAYEEMVVYSDAFEGNTKEGVYVATGTVRVRKEEQVVTGTRLTFHIHDNTARLENAQTAYDNLYLSGKTLDFTEKKTTLSSGTFTTCSLPEEKSHYHIHAKSIVLTGKSKIKAKGVSVYFRKTKILILPFLVMRLGEKKEGGESAFSYGMGYDRKDKFFAGGAFRFQGIRGVDTKLSVYYPVTKNKVFPFIEEIYENHAMTLSTGYGKKRMKDIRNDLLSVMLKPEVTAAFGPYAYSKVPVTFHLQGAYQSIDEIKDATKQKISGYRTKLFASAEHEPIPLTSTLDLTLFASQEKSFYHGGKTRGVFSGNVKLSNAFGKNLFLSAEYIRRQINGGTPFLFDEVDLVKEIKTSARAKLSKTLSLKTEIRYNTDTEKVYETEISVSNVFHCLEGTVSYNTRKKQVSGGIGIAEF